uniref:CND01460 n=1 Tax=Kwoniella heveanensis TaxID=89924 RepID=D2KCC9_9TREE|nr:CND01460 [Kwoniella heveanensis]
MLSPAHVPLPASPPTTASRRSSASTTQYYQPSPLSSPRISFRPRLDRNPTSATIRQEPPDPFKEGSTISVNQPVGSISISPCSRDVCLASRKGLYILDVANLNNAPRFIPQGGTWQIADVQWSPHPVTSHLILSTSSQKLLVWDLAAQKALHRSIDAHARAITDINWHALDPNLMATVSMDAGIRGWDLRCADKPVMRLCAWGAAGTQVKWNRRHDHILATAHGSLVNIWDDRKGSVPITTIRAHDSKIYGIDWDRRDRDKLVTCSLDKTIKFWTVPDLGPSASASHADFYSSISAPDKPTSVVTTTYPVWRARNLPFGSGVLSLPQRGERALEMFGPDDNTPIERFEGHENVVKDFVWRVRGGEDPSLDDRDFQLITWGKDRTLRIWPIERDVIARVGHQYGAPIRVLVSRRGAKDITYTKDPSDIDSEAAKLPPPVVNPSNLTRQKPTPKVEAGMTRGGNKAKGMDQLEWLTKVVKNAPSPDSSGVPSRAVSRAPSRARGQSVEDKTEWMSLKDEVVMVNKMFPRPRINFEKIDLSHRKLTLSMQGPWANGNRMAFIRIHWSFPPNYPYGPDIPTFDLERNPTVSQITRHGIVTTIKEMRAHNKQCLVQTCGYLLGPHERMGRRGIEEESDSESEKEGEPTRLTNVPMLIRTCGATFGPNGQLVCFFPKQVILPRTRNISRSPSITRDANPSPMLKAITALARLQNPHKRNTIRVKPRLRRLDQIPPPQVQAGSTMTIHNVSHLSQPSATLARLYKMSIENNLLQALEAKRLDHAEIWSTLRGVLTDPPPAYSALPPIARRHDDVRRERYIWEKSMARKKRIVDQVFTVLMAERDVQMLALISCVLLDHIKSSPVPPQPETLISRSPEQDYFTLPRVSTSHITPTRLPHRVGGSAPHSPNHSSFRTSGWSQMLNPSGISLRGALTPKDRNSFSDLPFAKTPLGASFEDASPTGMTIPGYKKVDSPKERNIDKQRLNAAGSSASPPITTPMRSSVTDRSYSSISEARSHKVSFGSASPLGKGLNRAGTAPNSATGTAYNTPAGYGAQTPSAGGPESAAGKDMVRTCSIRIDFPKDETPTITLLPAEMRSLCEAWKLAYADFLLRMDLLEARTTLLGYEFIPSSSLKSVSSKAASGEIVEIKLVGHKEPQNPQNPQNQAQVCVACSNKIDGICPSCNKPPRIALCSYCRIPIKGLSMGCSICAHRLHAKCFQAYFLSPLTPPTTCSSCTCSCLAHRGLSTPYYTIPISLKPSPSVTRGFARGNITPVSPPSAGIGFGSGGVDNGSSAGGGGRGRVTYASLAKLGSIKEGLGINPSSSSSLMPASAGVTASTSGLGTGFGSGQGAVLGGALGLNPEGVDERSSTPVPAGQAGGTGNREGLLARARWGDGGLLHWKSQSQSQTQNPNQGLGQGQGQNTSQN